MSRQRRSPLAIMALSVVLTLVGCGGGDVSEREVREQAARYLDGLASSDSELLCSVITEAEQARIALEAAETGTPGCEELAEVGANINADDLHRAADDIGLARVRIDGEYAAVFLDGKPGESLVVYSIFLVREDGEWRVDDHH